MALQLDYMWAFLATVEGDCFTCGYVPSNRVSDGKGRNYVGRIIPAATKYPDYISTGEPSDYTAMGASGVTIATGCDLGQTDTDTLHAYGLPSGIINQLRPYIGLRKADALRKLADMPLVIAHDTAALLDECVHAGYLQRYVEPAYNRASSVKFADLPRQAQAVVFSVCFQKGCGGVRRDWPNTWKHLTTQNWPAAAAELQSGFSQYVGRRRAEGELLKELC